MLTKNPQAKLAVYQLVYLFMKGFSSSWSLRTTNLTYYLTYSQYQGKLMDDLQKKIASM